MLAKTVEKMTYRNNARFMTKTLLSKLLYNTGYLDKYVKKLCRNQVLFLLYHKTGLNPDPMGLNVRPEIFERQIEVLKLYTRFISLHDAISKIKDNKIDGHYTVLTFDDGYRSNYEYAYPVLMKHSVPATIFLNVGAVEKNELYWEIINAIFSNKKNKTIKMGAEENEENHLQLNSVLERYEAIKNIHGRVKNMSKDEIGDFILNLRKENAVDNQRICSFISWKEASRMNKDLISFGSHGKSHVILTKVPPREWDQEIVDTKAVIERELGREVLAFAFPNGRKRDFNEALIAKIKAAGYKSALTSVPGVVGSKHTDLFRIPRVDVTERMSLGLDGKFSKAVFLAKVFGAL